MNFDRCPECGAAMRTGRRRKATRLILVDHLDSGLSFYVCPDCGAAFNPWHPNRQPDRWAATQPLVEGYRPCPTSYWERDIENQ